MLLSFGQCTLEPQCVSELEVDAQGRPARRVEAAVAPPPSTVRHECQVFAESTNRQIATIHVGLEPLEDRIEFIDGMRWMPTSHVESEYGFGEQPSLAWKGVPELESEWGVPRANLSYQAPKQARLLLAVSYDAMLTPLVTVVGASGAPVDESVRIDGAEVLGALRDGSHGDKEIRLARLPPVAASAPAAAAPAGAPASTSEVALRLSPAVRAWRDVIPPELLSTWLQEKPRTPEDIDRLLSRLRGREEAEGTISAIVRWRGYDREIATSAGHPRPLMTQVPSAGPADPCLVARCEWTVSSHAELELKIFKRRFDELLQSDANEKRLMGEVEVVAVVQLPPTAVKPDREATSEYAAALVQLSGVPLVRLPADIELVLAGALAESVTTADGDKGDDNGEDGGEGGEGGDDEAADTVVPVSVAVADPMSLIDHMIVHHPSASTTEMSLPPASSSSFDVPIDENAPKVILRVPCVLPSSPTAPSGPARTHLRLAHARQARVDGGSADHMRVGVLGCGTLRAWDPAQSEHANVSSRLQLDDDSLRVVMKLRDETVRQEAARQAAVRQEAGQHVAANEKHADKAASYASARIGWFASDAFETLRRAQPWREFEPRHPPISAGAAWENERSSLCRIRFGASLAPKDILGMRCHLPAPSIADALGLGAAKVAEAALDDAAANDEVEDSSMRAHAKYEGQTWTCTVVGEALSAGRGLMLRPDNTQALLPVDVRVGDDGNLTAAMLGDAAGDGGKTLHGRARPTDRVPLVREDSVPDGTPVLILHAGARVKPSTSEASLGATLSSAPDAVGRSPAISYAQVVEWLDGARHRLRIVDDGQTLVADLSPCTFCVTKLDAHAFDTARAAHCKRLASDTERVEDAITGRSFLVDKQLLGLETQHEHGVSVPRLVGVRSVRKLSTLLLEGSAGARMRGWTNEAPILIRAAPGTGKSWSVVQLVRRLSMRLQRDDSPCALVPLMITVQRLARFAVREAVVGSTKFAEHLRLAQKRTAETESMSESLASLRSQMSAMHAVQMKQLSRLRALEGRLQKTHDETSTTFKSTPSEQQTYLRRQHAECAKMVDEITQIEQRLVGASTATVTPHAIELARMGEREEQLAAELPLLTRSAEDTLKATSNGLLRLYLEHEYPSDQGRVQMLMQAFEMNRTVLVVDGVDEASGLRSQVEDWVLYTLARRGARLVVTSRPEGVTLERYTSHFVIFNLRALSDTQQRTAIMQQLRGDDAEEFFDHLLSFSAARRKHDYLFRTGWSVVERRRIQAVVECDQASVSDGQQDPRLQYAAAGGLALTTAEAGTIMDAMMHDLGVTDQVKLEWDSAEPTIDEAAAVEEHATNEALPGAGGLPVCRCRIVCTNARAMVAVQEGLSSGVKTLIPDLTSTPAFEPFASTDALLERLRSQSSRVVDSFRKWDDDMSGSIDRQEFRQGLLFLGKGSSSESMAKLLQQIDALFDAIDKDNSGTIELKELDKILRIGYDETLAKSLQEGAQGEIELDKKNKGYELRKGGKVGDSEIASSSIGVLEDDQGGPPKGLTATRSLPTLSVPPSRSAHMHPPPSRPSMLPPSRSSLALRPLTSVSPPSRAGLAPPPSRSSLAQRAAASIARMESMASIPPPSPSKSVRSIATPKAKTRPVPMRACRIDAVRVRNYFTHIELSHFRRVLTSVVVTLDGVTQRDTASPNYGVTTKRRRAVVEIELHEERMLEHHTQSDVATRHGFLRTALGNTCAPPLEPPSVLPAYASFSPRMLTNTPRLAWQLYLRTRRTP